MKRRRGAYGVVMAGLSIGAVAIMTLLLAAALLSRSDGRAGIEAPSSAAQSPAGSVLASGPEEVAGAVGEQELQEIEPGSEYRWRGGDSAQIVRLTRNLVAMPSSAIDPEDVLVAWDSLQAVVVRRPVHPRDAFPVFVSAGEHLMTLPESAGKRRSFARQ